MSSTAPSPTSIQDRSALRAAGTAGIVAAAILVVNAAKRAGLLPTTAATQLLAPMAEILAIALVTGLFAACAPALGRAGRVAFGLQFVALGCS